MTLVNAIQLANAHFIFNLHLGGQSRLFVGIARANGGVEFLDPSGIGREWGRTILGQRYLFEPSVKVFFTEFVNVRMAINFDIVAGLCDIDTIEHVKETLPFEWYPEFIIDHVEEDVCSFLVRSGDGEVVDLSFEDNSISRNCPGVEAGFVGGGCEAELL